MGNYNLKKTQIIQDDILNKTKDLEENSLLFNYKKKSNAKVLYEKKKNEFRTFFKALFLIEQSLEPITQITSFEYIGRFIILNTAKVLPSTLMLYCCYQLVLYVSSYFNLSWIQNLKNLPNCLQMQSFSIGILTTLPLLHYQILFLE